MMCVSILYANTPNNNNPKDMYKKAVIHIIADEFANHRPIPKCIEYSIQF